MLFRSPVRALRHDLNRWPSARRNLDPDKPVAQVPQDRRRDATDALAGPRISDKARFVEPFDGRSGSWKRGFDHTTLASNKKERVPAGAHSQLVSPFGEL